MVNSSSQGCGIARPNQILVTDSAHEKVKDGFLTVILDAPQLKGKSRQVLVHEVVDDLGK